MRTAAKSQLSSARNFISALSLAQAIKGFMRDRLRRIGEAGADVVFSQPWVAVEEIREAGALRELAQHEFHRHARVANYGLAQHYGGIDLNSRSHEELLLQS